MPVSLTATPPRALGALKAGLGLTVLATAVPLIDLVTLDSLTGHVRAAYPQWSADLVAMDRDAIVIALTVIGALGVAGWLVAIRAVAAGARWARVVTTVLFALGAVIALTTLSLSGGAYENVVPYLYGTLGALPVAAGAVAVARVWRP
ncbi:hypothetical protein [Nonomuraea sp. NPDC048826]|uniref:hypothetical protein n=1 Tax=Nonomuraea sp. NPDC048826 TaxID=3364347 RepID=UPI003717D6AA